MPAAAVGASGDGTDASFQFPVSSFQTSFSFLVSRFYEDGPREEWCQMFGDADRAHTGAAAAVGDAEGFVQVEVADIGADVAGSAQADLRVHVGAVHVDQAAVVVDDLAYFLDAFLEDAMSGGVSDHDAGEVVFSAAAALARRSGMSMLPWASHSTGTTVVESDDGGGGVGAVGGWWGLGRCYGRGWWVRGILVCRTGPRTARTRGTPVCRGTRFGFLSGLRGRRGWRGGRPSPWLAGVGLEGDGGEAMILGEPGFEVLKSIAGSRRSLVGGGEGMEAGEFRPGDGEHFRGGVELHGAGAEGNHGLAKREIAGFEALNVAEHFVLGVEGIEDGVCEEGGGAGFKFGGNAQTS